MSEFPTENKPKSTESTGVVMLGDVAEASVLMQALAEPRPPGDYSVKSAIARAAELANKLLPLKRRLSFSRAEDLWRLDARLVKPWEMDALRRAAAARKAVEDARPGTRDPFAPFRRLLQAYAEADPEFYRPQMEALERVLRGQGRVVPEGRDGSGSVGDAGAAR